MTRTILAAFWIDPLPAGATAGMGTTARAASVVVYLKDGARPLPGTDALAAVRAIWQSGGEAHHHHGYSPAPGVTALTVLTNLFAAHNATVMVASLAGGASVAVAQCPTALVPAGPFGLDRLVDHVYREWSTRQLAEPEPAWRIASPLPALVVAP